jgi:hypothetical protein
VPQARKTQALAGPAVDVSVISAGVRHETPCTQSKSRDVVEEERFVGPERHCVVSKARETDRSDISWPRRELARFASDAKEGICGAEIWMVGA